MNKFWEKVEHGNTKLIPYTLVILLILIIVELFVRIENEALHFAIELIDYLIIAIFVIDLIFLAFRARSTSFFFKHYWLDLLAVFPFSLFFNLVSSVWRGLAALEELLVGQSIFHEILESEKFLEKESKLVTKGGKLAKFFRILARILRVVIKSRLFQEFAEKHHHARHQLYKKQDQDNQNKKKQRRRPKR